MGGGGGGRVERRGGVVQCSDFDRTGLDGRLIIMTKPVDFGRSCTNVYR